MKWLFIVAVVFAKKACKTNKNTGATGLESFLKQDEAFVMFYGKKCPNSKAALKPFDSMGESSGVPMLKIAIEDENGQYTKQGEVLSKKYNIDGVPTFIFFRKGKPVGDKCYISDRKPAVIKKDLMECVAEARGTL